MSIAQSPPNDQRSGVPTKVVASVLVIVAVVCAWWPDLQRTADAQVDAGLNRALVSFAVARTLNAAISFAQGTELAIQPFGLGVTLALGQILDPANDLIESFSNLMLMASIAFGVQKILLMLFGTKVVSSLLTALAGIWLFLFAYNRAPVALTRFLVVLLAVRIGVPLVLIAGEQIHQYALKSEYDASTTLIERVAGEIESIQRNAETAPSAPAAPAPTSQSGDDQSKSAQRKEGVETAPNALAPTAPSSDDRQAKSLWGSAWDRAKDVANGAGQWSKKQLDRLQGEEGAETESIPLAPAPKSNNDDEPKSWWETIKGAVQGSSSSATEWSTEKMKSLRNKYAALKELVDSMIKHMLQLIAIFVVETLILPIGLLWVLMRLVGAPMRWVDRSGRFTKRGSVGHHEAPSS